MPSSAWVPSSGSGSAGAGSTPLGTGADVSTLNNDDILSRAKKPQLITDYNAELQIKSQLDAQATALGVSASAYDTSVATLTSFLQGLGGTGPAWNFLDVTTDTSMGVSGGATLRNDWNSVSANRAALQRALTDKVQANTDYANTMAHSSHNLIKNGNSEDANPTGFEAVLVSPSGAYTGTKGRFLAGDGTAGVYYITPNIACTDGDQFYMEFMGARVGSGGGHGYFSLVWFNSSGVAFAGEDFDFSVATAGPWGKYSRLVTAPSGTVACAWRFQKTADLPAGNNVYFDHLYAGRAISRAMLQGDAIQTSNYAETAGNPTAGARMDTSGTSLKTHKDGLQIGATVFSEYLMSRITQGLDGTTALGRICYRGSIDTTTRGGTPDISKLTLTRQRWDTTNHIGRLGLVLQPTAPADNLDAMRFAQIVLYRQSAAGTTATLTAVDTYDLPLTDRLYYNWSTDSNTNNAAKFTFESGDSLISSGFPAALVTLYNAYGPSAGGCFYAATGNVDGSTLTYNGSTWPAGITGGTSGGGGGTGTGGGGACPAPWVQITLASGLVVDAGDLYDGAVVIGVNDSTMDPMVGTVRRPSIEFEMRAAVLLEDGRAPEFSLPHRLAVEGKGWVAVRDLQPGDSILGQRTSIVKGVGSAFLGQVVKFSVDGCHTYLADGLLSHNIKILS